MSDFYYGKVKDPEYFAQGRLAAHSDHVCYADRKEADAKQTSLRMSLDGVWKFHYARNYEQTIPGFEREDYDCG